MRILPLLALLLAPSRPLPQEEEKRLLYVATPGIRITSSGAARASSSTTSTTPRPAAAHPVSYLDAKDPEGSPENVKGSARARKPGSSTCRP